MITTSQDTEAFKQAALVAPYGDDAKVKELTNYVVGRGHPILQIYRFSSDDRQHVKALLALAQFPLNSSVLDMGCGIGKVAELMASERPDLEFCLLNVSPSQLAMCPDRFPKVSVDMHNTGLKDASFDAVMVNYALGHSLLDDFLPEVARLLVPGGVLFIYDLAAENSEKLISQLGYNAHSIDKTVRAAVNAGFDIDRYGIPNDTNVEDFYDILDKETFTALFHGVVPVFYRFTRC